MLKKSSPSVKRWLITAGRILVTALLLLVVFRRVDWKEIMDTMAVISPALWLSWLLLSILAMIIPAARFGYLTDASLGITRDIPFWLRLHFKAQFYNQVVPGTVGGDASRALGVVSERSELPRVAAVVTLDRLMGMAATLLILSGTLLLGKTPGIENGHQLWGVILLILGLIIAAGFVYRMLMKQERYPWLRLPAVNAKALGVVVLMALMYQVADIMVAFGYGRSLSIDVKWSYYLLIIPLTYIVTAIPVSLNGLGVREYTLVTLLTLQGVPPPLSLSLSLLIFIDRLVKALLGLIIIWLEKK